jgi:NAD(P)-dependent dehydrogenase (short-subunit alcohol dehydrogenase family)
LPKTALIVGASRGLGLAIASEFVARGWNVIGTVRAGVRTLLHDVAEANAGRIAIEPLDIDDAGQIAALGKRLSGRTIDMLFVNAGTTTHDPRIGIGAVSSEEFNRVIVTNALGPMRVVEALQSLVPSEGLIAVMTSGQGSIANNRNGVGDVYRASKAALNMLMRGFEARQPGRALLLLAPGWIRTDLGGADAPFTVEESTPILTDLLVGAIGTPGLRYIDRFGKIVPW